MNQSTGNNRKTSMTRLRDSHLVNDIMRVPNGKRQLLETCSRDNRLRIASSFSLSMAPPWLNQSRDKNLKRNNSSAKYNIVSGDMSQMGNRRVVL